ncbi:MAG: hypothetical protein CL489_17610 [Acidobacteria bacterium]|nr:hypothetical protein [Acidobacteriota bacterium]
MFSRREALRVFGAAAALPLFDPGRLHHPLAQVPSGQAWQPRFLDVNQVETVASIAECIIPRTDTPGARDAGVHEYVDFALERAEATVQQRFTDGLTWFTAHVATLRRRTFTELGRDEQSRLLAELSEPTSSQGPAFFVQMKELTIEGYYRSEAGMFQELKFAGNTFLSEFEGCSHEEHLSWQPAEANSTAERDS